MMTHTSTPRKRKTVKKRRLSVELWLHGQQLHRMQGAEPQRQDACGEGGAAPYSLPPLLPAERGILLGPTACRLVSISKPT